MGYLNTELEILEASDPTPETKTESVGALAPKLKLVGAHDYNGRSERTRDPNRNRISFRPKNEILTAVRVYCAENDISLTQFFELASLSLLKLSPQYVTLAGAKAPNDDLNDLTLYLTKPFIINIYLRWTTAFNSKEATRGKPWTPRWTPNDDANGLQFNERDPRLIELGIIRTISQKPPNWGQIYTFKYYIPEIETMINGATNLSSDIIDIMLESHRDRITRHLDKR
jgi:hypothetical protein